MFRRVLCLCALALCPAVLTLGSLPSFAAVPAEAPELALVPNSNPPIRPMAAPPTSEDGLLRGHEQNVQKNSNGIGFSAAVYPQFGFTYRRYFGNTALQFNILPLLYNGGDYLSLHLGVEFIDYMLVWTRPRSGGIIGPATALRLVAATGLSMSRDQKTNITVPSENCQTQVCKDAIQGNHGRIDYLASGAVGFGFEFGSIMRPGFSVAVDLMMTVLWDNDGFYAAYPLPSGTLMYNW